MVNFILKAVFDSCIVLDCLLTVIRRHHYCGLESFLVKVESKGLPTQANMVGGQTHKGDITGEKTMGNL